MNNALFITTPTMMTASVLRAWMAGGNRIAEIWFCEPDSAFLRPPRGISGKLFPEFDAVRVARDAGLKLRMCPPLRTWAGAVDAAKQTGADCLFSVFTMQIIPAELLDVFKQRAVNLHPALLPHFRGPTPIQAMLIDGKADLAGGITIHRLTKGIDEGAIVAQAGCPRLSAKNLFTWELLLAECAEKLVRGELQTYLAGESPAIEQSESEASYRRVSSFELSLGSHLRYDEIEHRLKVFGPHHFHSWVTDDQRFVKVTGKLRRIGPCTGAPQKISPFFVESDVVDARVVIARRTLPSQIMRQIARIAAKHTAHSKLVGISK